MIDEQGFVVGLARIGLALRQPPDAATIGVYFDSLARELEAPSWEAFCRWAVDAGRWQWFPKLSEIRDALREFRGEPPLEAEAALAYERVMAAGDYTAEAGTVWNLRAVVARCGRAAGEAFLVAGGPNAFAITWDEGRRRQRFVEAYAQAVREEPDAALLPPAPPPRALPESAGEQLGAREVLDRVRALVPEPAPPRRAEVVVATDERLAYLRRQAEAMKAESGTGGGDGESEGGADGTGGAAARCARCACRWS